ncbi:MAG: hypothetical protein AB7S99_08795 [Pseudodonghicola sp.]
MTTISFTGSRANFFGADGDTVTVDETQLSIIVPSASSTFSYSVIGDFDGVPLVDLTPVPVEGLLDGVLTIAELEKSTDLDAAIAQISWAGGVSTVLILSFMTGTNEDTDIFFTLDGPEIPEFGSIRQWRAFDNSITDIGPATGAYAPGVDILWTDIAGATVTEDDVFHGTDGNDILKGGIGNDVFFSTSGKDTYNGGAGIDQLTFSQSDPAGVIVNLATGRAVDGWGNVEKVIGIEVVQGTDFNDRMIGDKVANVMLGLAGKDYLDGGKGVDRVSYDQDASFGGTGGVTVNLQKGYAIDGFGDRDTLKSFENVRGTEVKDTIIGSGAKNLLEGLGGNDVLKGLGGNDTLLGGAGLDRLDGGAGNDRLVGGAQADRFIFSGDFGNDTIVDFQTAGTKEKIDLSQVTEIRNFSDLVNNHLSDVNGTAVIDDGAGNTITLSGVAVADLAANDFLF